MVVLEVWERRSVEVNPSPQVVMVLPPYVCTLTFKCRNVWTDLCDCRLPLYTSFQQATLSPMNTLISGWLTLWIWLMCPRSLVAIPHYPSNHPILNIDYGKKWIFLSTPNQGMHLADCFH